MNCAVGAEKTSRACSRLDQARCTTNAVTCRFRCRLNRSAQTKQSLKIGTNFKMDNTNTIAGLIINHLERIPKTSEELVIDDTKFTVLKTSKKTVSIVRAKINRKK